ncbi:MAG: hypothetical protein ACRDY3_10000 [Acidimicrobiales bacterium]
MNHFTFPCCVALGGDPITRANPVAHPDDVDERRRLAPWCRDKAQPSVLDMLVKLRSVIIVGQFRQGAPQPLTAREITTLRLAWEDVAA